MTSIDLKNIKSKSIRAVFLSIAHSPKITRAEIAKETGLSLMTVGKIADILTRIGITEEEKESSGSVGRRAASTRISDLYYGILLDVSSQTFVCEIVDAGTNTMDQFFYSYNPNYYREENILLFLKNLTLYLSTRYDPEKCFGIGAITEKFMRSTSTSTQPQSPEDSSRKFEFQKEIEDALADYSSNIQWASLVESAAYCIAESTPHHKEKAILYGYIESNAQSAMIIHGEIFKGSNGPIGNIEPWLSPITPFTDSPKTISEIATAISRASALLDPHEIVIEIDEHDAAFISELQSCLFDMRLNCENLTVRSQGARSARHGVALRLRDQWVDSIISREI